MTHGATAHDRLRALGLSLPATLPSLGAYAPTSRTGELLWVAGHTSRTADAPARRGVVGSGLTVAEAAEEAGRAALNLLATVEAAVGLDRVAAVVQLRGYVRSQSDFAEHPQVIDGASRLLGAVFPTAPPHARAAVGVVSLPGGACVELEAVFSIAS